MINYFKNLFKALIGYPNHKIVIEKEVVREPYERVHNFVDDVLEANRHYIASIDVGNFDRVFEGMTEQEKKDYVALASNIWINKAFQKEIKHLLAGQTTYVAAQCENWDQSLVGRGGINGIGLVLDTFKKLHSIHLENVGQTKVGSDISSLMQ